MKLDILDRALVWLENNRSQFVIVNEQSHPYYTIKPVAELAEAAEVISRSGRSKQGTALLEHAWTQLRGGELILALLERGPETLVQAAIYMPFYRTHLRNAQLDAAIATRAKWAEAAPPLHHLPIAATLTTMGLIPPWTLTQVIEQEWATRMGSPWSLSATDLYMAAHIAFYATDYGRKPDGLPAAQIEYLQRWIPVWLDELGSHGQLDLVAELAIAWHCLGGDCVAPAVWNHLGSKQRADGSIPYEVNDQRKVGVPGMTPEREQFLRDYHSTLVTLMACVVCTHADVVN